MADTTIKPRTYRAVPRQGMRKWCVIQDVAGATVVVAEFHAYPAAMAETNRLNAMATDAKIAPVESQVDHREKVLA